MAQATPNVDITVDSNEPNEGLLKVLETIRPSWKKGDIKFESMQQGYINRMVLCKADEDNDNWLVARIFGVAMDVLMVEREREVRNSELLSEVGVGPRVVGTFNNGLIFAYVNGKTYFWSDLSAFRHTKLLNSVARTYAKMHSKAVLELAVNKYRLHEGRSKDDFIKKFTQDLPAVIVDEDTTKWYNNQVPTNEERRLELKMIIEYWLRMGTDWHFIHNDSNPTNVIYDEEKDKVILVDFEMCIISDPFTDLAFFLETSAVGMAPDPEGLRHRPEVYDEVIRTYLKERYQLDDIKRAVTDEEVERYMEIIEAISISTYYLFHTMAPFVVLADPGRHGDPKLLLGLGIARLAYYRKNRDRMLEIFNKYKTPTPRVPIPSSENNGDK